MYYYCTFRACLWRKVKTYGCSQGSLPLLATVRSVSHIAIPKCKTTQPRRNALGIQMLSEGLYQQIFKDRLKYSNISDEKLEESIKHLSSFDLWGKETETLNEIAFDLPKLQGRNINEHFKAIAKQQAGAYAEALHKLISNPLPTLPHKKKWLNTPGWTKYSYAADGNLESESVDFPDDSAVIFDCEVLVNLADLPIMAVAVSNTAWYSWTSKHVASNNNNIDNNFEDLIPMECIQKVQSNPKKTPAKLIIGHNVGFDRARIKEQYLPQLTRTRFLDTMSMHIALSGYSSQQKMSKATVKDSVHSEEKPSVLEASWVRSGSLNSLTAVHEHYCGKPLDKTARNIFITGKMEDVQADFNELMEYCAKDVLATYNVLVKLTPMFFKHFPHIVTFAGMLELGQMYLPINNNWHRYVHSCQQEYDNLNLELKRNLINIMNDACHLLDGEKYKEDKWLQNMDWTVKTRKLNKSPRKGFKLEHPEPVKLKMYLQNQQHMSEKENAELGKCTKTYQKNQVHSYPLLEKLCAFADRLPLTKTHLPGCPQWYRELQCKEDDKEWNHDSTMLSTLTRATPKLLRMTWLGYPLYHSEKRGWGYLMPINEEKYVDAFENVNDILQEVNDSKDTTAILHTPAEKLEGIPDDYTFHRLPHKNGLGKNVGSPLAHDFIDHIENGTLSSIDFSNARRCLEINKLCSYWRSARKRILSQIDIFVDEKYLPSAVVINPFYKKDMNYGAIVPQVISCGTISRRAVERTWLTASNVELDRIGSELKAMVQAPPGHVFVGADVDSQELWIASLLGDASFVGDHGCTALSWMTLQGSKKDGTDLHSKTAKAVGMSRNEAKIFNYARMYGAGKATALRQYMQHNQNEPKKECIEKINKLFAMTKGHLLYQLSSDALWIINKTNVQISTTAKLTNYATYEELIKIQKAAFDAFGHIKNIILSDLYIRKRWHGGIESHMFNKVGDIATSASPETPVLSCRISKALQPDKVGTRFMPSRMNWVVQSSAVDYLHLLLVAMRWLIDTFNLDARFILSIHDEVRYMSTTDHQHLVALALQISNLWTRCMFAHQLGMKDLPLSVAFFSSIEIDHVLRKEASDDCVTPSNPSGLESKYGIPLGKSYDIHDILRMTGNGNFQ